MNKKKPETKLVHIGRNLRFTQNAVNPIIQRASSLIFESLAIKEQAAAQRTNGALFYGRRGTLTHFALQDAMTELEGGAGCALYPCGTAAITNSILSFIETGDHILMVNSAYAPTQDFCNSVLTRLHVCTTYFDPLIGKNIKQLIQPNTRIVFFESPGSITMEIQDIPAMVEAIRATNPEIIIMIDNTWAAGVLFKALDFDIDISIQSGTKYLIGHSDYMLGTAVANSRCWEQLRENSYLMGQMLDADTAYMACRGLRTLITRLTQHEKNSKIIANWLEKRPEVAEVFHPALTSCRGHEFFLRDFNGCNGLFSFVLKRRLSHKQLANYLDGFQFFSMAYSWGGFESLILAYQPEELQAIRVNSNINFAGTLIRLHVGLENVQDLIEDLSVGFERLAQ